MARKPMVTRTIPSTSVTYMCVEIASKRIDERTVLLPRTYADNDAIIKAINAQLDTDVVKAVSVLSSNVVYNKYCMDEAKFISYADSVIPVDESEAE